MNYLSPTKGKIAVVGAVIVIALYPKVFGWHRPYINWLPWELAEYLVEKNRPASECFDLHWFEILSPTQAEQRALCVYEYAKRKKDPSACELLMPSNYGWSCLGAAEEPNQRWCWFDFGKDPAIVGRGAISIAMPECKNNPKSMRDNKCCELAMALYINHEQHCKAFEQGPQKLHDQCLELLANRERNMNYCSSIISANVKAACEVSTRALEADGTDTVEKN